jgi:Gar1/Naf1 RNA binding region
VEPKKFSSEPFFNSYFAAMGAFMHACEGELVCESINPKVPYFNAPIFLENKVCSIQAKA